MLVQRVIATARGSIHCLITDVGRGPTLVLLHPLASSGELWRPWLEWIDARGGRACAPTLPRLPDAGAVDAKVTIADMASDVAALIEALEFDRPAILGMSMGGCVAQSLLLDHPRSASCLVLADTTSTYGIDRVERWDARARAAMTPARDELLPFQLDRWFSPAFRERDAAEVARIAAIFLACPGNVHAACCRALGAFDVSTRLDAIQVPTRVLVGENDYATPVSMSAALARAIPDATLDVVPNVRHMSVIEVPDCRESVWRFVITHTPVAAN